MHKADLKRNLEAELLKIERQDKKIYGVGETRYDLMIKDVLIYIDNSISKEAIEEKIEKINKRNDTIYIGERSNGKTFRQAVNDEVKKVLQELLEGK